MVDVVASRLAPELVQPSLEFWSCVEDRVQKKAQQGTASNVCRPGATLVGTLFFSVLKSVFLRRRVFFSLLYRF